MSEVTLLFGSIQTLKDLNVQTHLTFATPLKYSVKYAETCEIESFRLDPRKIRIFVTVTSAGFSHSSYSRGICG